MPELDCYPEHSLCTGCRSRLSPRARFCRNCGRNVVDGITRELPAVAAPIRGDFDNHWKNVRHVALLFGSLLGFAFVFATVHHFYPSPWIGVIESLADSAVIVGFAVVRRSDIAALFALPRCDRRTALMLVLIAVSFLLLLRAYFDLLARWGVPMANMTAEYRRAGWPVGSMFLLLSILPGIVEEIGFRGVMQSLLEHTVDAREAWLIQAALFSVLHLSPIVFPSHFVMGLVFGYLRLRSRSLYPGMALHATWNALVVFAEI
jgi:membrane protease YdiL (CAAX protease family)